MKNLDFFIVMFIKIVDQSHRNLMKYHSWSNLPKCLGKAIEMNDQLEWNNQLFFFYLLSVYFFISIPFFMIFLYFRYKTRLVIRITKANNKELDAITLAK